MQASLSEELQSQNVQLSQSADQAKLDAALKDEEIKNLQGELQKKVAEYQELIESQRQEYEQRQGGLEKKLSEQQRATQLEIHELRTKHEEELSSALNKHNDETTRLEQLHTSNIQSLTNNWREQETKLKSSLEDEKSSLHSKISDLTGQLQQMEENLCQGSDYRVKRAEKAMLTLQQEVDSLKTVLEMKTSEVRELRSEKVKLEEKLDLYDQQQLSLRKMSAQVCFDLIFSLLILILVKCKVKHNLTEIKEEPD